MRNLRRGISVVTMTTMLIMLLMGAGKVEARAYNKVQSVKSNTVEVTKKDTIYTHTGTAKGSDGRQASYDENPISMFYVNGQKDPVICVEPSQHFWESEELGYTVEPYQQEKLAAIKYYSYWLTDRTDYDFVVWQLMTWEEFGYIPTRHTVPDYDKRKAEINKQIQAHSQLPSFANETITINVGETVRLDDKNNMWNMFTLRENSGNFEVLNVRDSLFITATKKSKSGMLRADKYGNSEMMGASILYKNPNSQDLALLFLQNSVSMKLQINIANGNLKFSKTGPSMTGVKVTKDAEIGADIYMQKWQEVSRSGGEIGIFARNEIKNHQQETLYKKDALVETLVSLSANAAVSVDLASGDYYWKETKAPYGLLIDESEHDFSVTDGGGENQAFFADLTNDKADQVLLMSKAFETDPSIASDPDAYKDSIWVIKTKNDILYDDKEVAIPKGSIVKKFYIGKNGNPIDKRIETDANADGKISETEVEEVALHLDLQEGDYAAVEVATNEDYVLDTSEYAFKVAYQGEDVKEQQLVVNDQKPIVNQLKVPPAPSTNDTSDIDSFIVIGVVSFTLLFIGGCVYVIRRKRAKTK